MIVFSNFQVLQVEVCVFSPYMLKCLKLQKFGELQIKQTLPREGSDIQYILLTFLFKDVTDFTHTCREQSLNLQPEALYI